MPHKEDDHDDDHDDHDDDHEHDEFHLEIHRAVDELGKYAIEIEIEGTVRKERIIKMIEETMHDATVRCMERGADMVGHTKSILECREGSIMSSLIDMNLPIKIKDGVSDGDVTDAKYILHVIVHGIWDDKVRECSLETVPAVFDRLGIKYKVIADYYDIEKSVAHHL